MIHTDSYKSLAKMDKRNKQTDVEKIKEIIKSQI